MILSMLNLITVILSQNLKLKNKQSKFYQNFKNFKNLNLNDTVARRVLEMCKRTSIYRIYEFAENNLTYISVEQMKSRI